MPARGHLHWGGAFGVLRSHLLMVNLQHANSDLGQQLMSE